MLKSQGNLTEAQNAYQQNLAIFGHLVKMDPTNGAWQNNLAAAYERVGDLLLAQGNVPEAIKAYQDDLAISEQLVKTAPNNTAWQRDLSLSYNEVASALEAKGDLAGATKLYEARVEIAERLAKLDPGNAGWQGDLALAYSIAGGRLALQGKLAEATVSLERSISIYERLATNSGDAWTQANYGTALAMLGIAKGKNGQAEMRRALAILHPLRDANRLNPQQAALIPTLEKLAGSPLPLAAVAAFQEGKYAEAVALQVKYAAAEEKAERKKGGKPGPNTARALLGVAGYKLFAHDFKGALAASERATKLSPDPIYAAAKAHALLFLGREREARAIYLRYKGQPVEAGGKLWEETIRDDFKLAEAHGLKHAGMAEIREQLAAK